VKITYNYESLDRHGVTEQEADGVYATGKDFDLESNTSGNDRIMLVGWTSAGRLLRSVLSTCHMDMITYFTQSTPLNLIVNCLRRKNNYGN
jgi:hypothetical protein